MVNFDRLFHLFLSKKAVMIVVYTLESDTREEQTKKREKGNKEDYHNYIKSYLEEQKQRRNEEQNEQL